MRRYLLSLCLAVLAAPSLLAQSAGDIFFQKRPASAGPLVPLWITPANNKFLGFNGSGVLSLLDGSSEGSITIGGIEVDLGGSVTMTDLLDTVDATYGGLLTRGFSGWTGIGPSDSDKVLTSNGGGSLPSYRYVTGLHVAVNAHYIYVGPTSGSPDFPTFRALVADDIPDLSGVYLTPGGDGSGLSGITQSQVSGLTTADRANFANVLVTHSTLTYGATTTIDMDGNGFQTVTLTGNVTFATSNRASGRSKTIRIIGDSTSRTLTFPSWKFVGASAPTALAGSKVAILTITAFGTADTDIIAAFAAEP